MKNLLRITAAFGAGMLLMYFLDPNAGRRRRALVRDRAVATGHDVQRMAAAGSRHAANHLRGVAARTRGRFSSEDIEDDRLEARIRSRLGRLVERPHGVEVRVHDGCVVLKGVAAEDEIDDLVDAIASMRGVEEVDCHLAPGTTVAPAEGTAEARH
jgi:osmotically-inducible protein OsmY